MTNLTSKEYQLFKSDLAGFYLKDRESFEQNYQDLMDAACNSKGAVKTAINKEMELYSDARAMARTYIKIIKEAI